MKMGAQKRERERGGSKNTQSKAEMEIMGEGQIESGASS